MEPVNPSRHRALRSGLFALAMTVVLAVPAHSAPPVMTRDEIINLGKSGVGYSYWWGHGRWRTDGASHGSCSGSCPGCSHSGSYGADCSGFVAKTWQVPSASPVTTDAHPYSTWHFTCTTTHWKAIAASSLVRGDAASYRNTGCPGTAGHVVLYESGSAWSDIWIYEARGCATGIRHNMRSLGSNYRAIRRNALGASCTPTTEVCNNADDDCDGEKDEGNVCVVDEELTLQAGSWETGTTDIDGDGLADVCARAAAGIRCHLSSGTGLTVSVNGPELSDATGWDDITNYSTLRLADIDGDGLADLCARANAGIYCYRSTGTGFAAGVAGPALADASNWNQVQYYSTIRMADINGDGRADLCARAGAGFQCWTSRGDGTFSGTINGPTLSNDSGWNGVDHYGTIRMGDVNGDGKDDVCARGAAGMFCWLSDGAGFPTKVNGPAWSDDSGWTNVIYWSTIRMADVNGDGKDDLCARTSTDFRCHLSTGSGFGGAIIGPLMANATGWNDYSNYSTIRMGDINGDGRADICARPNRGWACWKSTGDEFEETPTEPMAWSDASGWDAPSAFRTIRMADINGDGRADVCGRGASGAECWLSDGNGFPTKVAGPTWTDGSGWGAQDHYSTFRVGTSTVAFCAPSAEVCDGLDNDCDGAVDNGLVCDPPPQDTWSGGTDTFSGSDTVSGSDTTPGIDLGPPHPGDTSVAVDAGPDAWLTDAVGPQPGVDVGGDVDVTVDRLNAGQNLSTGCACTVAAHRPSRGAGVFGLLLVVGLISQWRRRRR